MTIKSWIMFFVCLVLLQGMAKAETVYTSVFNVFDSVRTDKLLILSSIDGRVYKMHRTIDSASRMKSLVGRIVRIDYILDGRQAVITNIREARNGEIDENAIDLNHFRYNQLREFAPTELQTYDRAVVVFNDMLNDGDKNRSQCFKRAHMWAFDMWSKLGISSEKIFMFYTKRYQILEEFDWWFHVAPLVTAGGVEYVMDGTFMKKPMQIQEWKNYFLKTDKITCPEINSIQEYEKSQWTRICFLMKVPMYYFSPLDIEGRDKQGIQRNHWVLEELQDARKAFKNWEDSYEGLDTGKHVRKF